jgi:hypothetical protein
MGWQPGPGGGTGTGPDRGPGLPGGAPPARDPRLSLFAGDGSQAGPVPSGRLALLADELSGAGRRCPGATDNELVGLLREWAALESWAAGAKLGVVRELMRREGTPSPGSGHGDLPETWSPSLRHELAGALACSTQSAETTTWLAWELQARLPGTGALLDHGIITFAKARAIVETFRYLSDADAARAESTILGQLTGKTYTQVLRLAEQAALTVDPQLAARRREQAQKKDARVTFLREQAGTAALSGRDLPPDEALAAMASVNARAEQYRESGAFGDTRMDVLRAQAYLDLLNDKLRHLVQVRDGTCTFPPCNRHARESDFEHALPYDKGGKTCTCNAGARSRACHRVKQCKGWNVTQPKPGWHRWETPAGRVYVQEPKRYPA